MHFPSYLTFRSKLALLFAGVLTVLLTAASYVSMRNVRNLSGHLESSYADSVVPLRTAQIADQAFDHMELDLLNAILEGGKARKEALAAFTTRRATFERVLAEYKRHATNEPAMEQLLAKYGMLEDQKRRSDRAFAQIEAAYPQLIARFDQIVSLLHSNRQKEAEAVYRSCVPLISQVDIGTNAFMVLEVEQGATLDKERQVIAESANTQIAAIAAAALGLGILLVFIIARSITVPLLRLTAAARGIKSGDLDQVVQVESRDEVGQLALAFNTMTESLRGARAELEGRVEARTRELESANELLSAQMAERERASRALEQAKEVAEAANRAKSDFLAKMSHEIRTPMTGVMGAVELTLNTKLTPAQREYLEIARTSSEALLQVINDILDFARIESGKLQFEAVDFELCENVADALATLSVRAQEKGLRLAYHVDPVIPDHVVGDPRRLRQVLLNLVGNAIKFTERGEVTVSVQQEMRTNDDVTLHFAIQDTGIGISEEQRSHIFMPFEQADGSITRRYGGTGLGLPIAAQLTDLMGGRIWVESETSKGSTFHFTARLGIADRARTHGMWSAAAGLPEPQQHAHTAQGLRPARQLNILVTDDNVVIQKIATRILEAWGHTVEVAGSGREALCKLDKQVFDVVLMDIQMPEMDGFETTRAIRDRDEESHTYTPVVAITAHALRGDRERCLQVGMDGYVSKPLDQRELFSCIEAAASLMAGNDDVGYGAKDSELTESFRAQDTDTTDACENEDKQWSKR